MKYVSISALLSVLASIALAPTWSHAANELEPVRCVDLARIDHTEVLDNQSILFHMRGGNVYLNRLTHRCPGLEHNPFMYRTHVSRVCDVDVITVLENWGFALTPGISCGLGSFVPVDEAEIARLKGKPADVSIDPVETTE